MANKRERHRGQGAGKREGNAARRGRADDRHELVYGRQPVRELLRAGRRRIRAVWLAQGAKPSPELDEIVTLAEEQGATVERPDARQLERWAGSGNHQGVVARVEGYPYADFKAVLNGLAHAEAPVLIAVLADIQDPQNLGAILRTAEAAGVDAVLIHAKRAVDVTPAVVRASAGASEHMQVVKVPNITNALRALRDENVQIVGLEGVPEALPYTDLNVHGSVALVIGSEGGGLRRLVRETCDVLVRLPVSGRVSSLNAGVAAGIAIYEIRRRQREQRHGSMPGIGGDGLEQR